MNSLFTLYNNGWFLCSYYDQQWKEQAYMFVRQLFAFKSYKNEVTERTKENKKEQSKFDMGYKT